ncbi:sugar transferase [Oscillatoria sp. CS-180]|uniref:sugar transferase n=1 Tax=Oscillatoria sp. CS-180 TaxID=3021720 RepID=UPI00232C6380|nr:sugar transferase [Oscillatoria sp. CS-180]MDB9524961.1 sugar transferase [Oscillatoria sp. CS-180]
MESTASTKAVSSSIYEQIPEVVHPSVSCIIKRSMDILGSFIGLLLLTGIVVPIAIAIKIDSPGPVFYSQERYGLHGKTFHIWKFRSMIANADDLKTLIENQVQGQLFKNEDDPRITRVGRFLRRTSLDEFPQFWNVFKGDMSLVGTRPPTHDEVAKYEAHHWERLNVKPGITGQWQVNGRSSIKDFEEVVKLDLLYQEIWNPLYDLKLILKTIFYVLFRLNAF